jgi:hypothetical protein
MSLPHFLDDLWKTFAIRSAAASAGSYGTWKIYAQKSEACTAPSLISIVRTGIGA